MAESLLQKAQRLGIQPAATSTGETLIQKAQRLGIQPAQQTEQPNYFERVGQNFAQTGKEITDSIQKGAETYSTESAKGNVFKATGGLLRSGLRTVGGVAEAAFNPIFELPVVKGVVEKIGQKVLGVPQIKDFVTEATLLAEQYPEQATDLKNIVDILTLGGGKAVEKPLLQEGKLIAKDIAGSTQAMLSTSEEAVQKNIIEMFNKSVKPTAKKTIAQGQKYENDTLNALKTIKANAEKLNIEDATGEIITGRTPQSLNELAQGLDQTKKIVFNQYDTLAKEAGAVGATIDAKPIADEVSKVAQNRALQITNPEVVKYAEQWAERLRGLDMLDTETTQAVIQNLNNNLQAFYKNPTYEAASKVAVDAGVVNNFRKALDDAIEGATGEQYQAIKRQYGALKAIENDVTRAAMRDARKNVKGLLDYTDMFTSGQMLGGILQLNPAMFTKGAIERGFKEYFKFLNDPNRAIENIFENLNIKTGDVFKPQSTIGKYLENPKLGMSIEDVSKTASKTDDTFLSEARKYKSAEEFVKAQIKLPTKANFNNDTKGMWNNIKNVGDYKIARVNFDSNQWKLVDTNDFQEVAKDSYKPIKEFYSRDELYDFIKSDTKSQLTDIWNKANQTGDNLINEAKKYKSAEEFVKSQPNIKEYSPLTPQQTERSIKMLNESGVPVKSGDDIITLYHGTNAKGVKGINESGTLNPFSYLATDKNASKGFVFGKGGDVLEIKVPVKDAGFVQQSMAGTKGATIQNPVRLVKGKDGIWRAEEWKSKSQLTDIWKKANKK